MAFQDPPLSLYAELLLNVKQVSVVASLTSHPGASTKADISNDGTKFSIQHGGSSRQIELPGQVSAPGATLPIPPPRASGGSTVLTWRLPMLAAAPGLSIHDGNDPVVPWTALDISARSSVSCRSCSKVFVSQEALQDWKDLPSENWAEMMDFWHCHKPHDDEDGHGHDHFASDANEHKGHTQEHLAQRAYGANSSISARKATGFVDLSSFLFAEEDSSGLLYSTSGPQSGHSSSSGAVKAAGGSVPPRMLHIYCSSCKTHAGFFNVSNASVILFKWQVSCSTISNRLEPSSSDCLAATLLATLARSGSSKSLIVPTMQSSHSPDEPATSTITGESPSAPLHLWIFNGNVAYSSSSRRGGPRTALKILYKRVSQEAADKMLESFSSDVQEVNLPLDAIAATSQVLDASNGILPPSEQAYNEWKVGLLNKWIG